MVDEAERRIGAAAERQHGVVTRPQLIEVGLSPWKIEYRLKVGRLRRLHRGVYLVGPTEPSRAREMSAVLAGGPGAVLSHGSAAAAWGLIPKPVRATEPVDITVQGTNRGRRRGIRVHRVERLEPAERTVQDGVPITSPDRTVVDVAAAVSGRQLERIVARAERDGLLKENTLAGLVDRYRGRPGIRALRAVLELQGGPALTRSEAESSLLALVREAGLPTPRANVRLGAYEVDFLWPRERVAVEVDGFRYHSSRVQFERDRERDARLSAKGIKVIRLLWRQLSDQRMATAVRLGQALEAAAR